jgi:methylmalonyl-CoA mutase N-terminal domain/subunit
MLEGVYGGMDSGWFQGRISESAYALERSLESGERVVVGVNGFTDGDTDRPDLLRIDTAVEDRQRKRLAEVKAERPAAAVVAALARVAEDAGRADVNLMPSIGEAVKAYATVGEVIEALASVFGRWRETPVL